VSEPAESRRRHSELGEATVAALARRTRTSVEVVKHLYDAEIAELQSTSVVKNFIDVIARRRVKQRLMTADSASRQARLIEPG
jgi:Protein of unknown function (DUF3562)